MKNIKFFLFVLFLGFAFGGVAGVSYADWERPKETTDADKVDAYRSTGLPLPRFVSLGKEEVFVRAGPEQKYPIKWVYMRQNYPVEIILEYGNWRKIRDIDGDEGWVFHALLSGERYGIVMAGGIVPAYKKPSNSVSSRVVAKFEPRVIVAIHECRQGWCEVETSGYRGWVERKYLWGVYEDENFD